MLLGLQGFFTRLCGANFLLIHGGQGCIYTGVEVEDRDEVGALEKAANGITGTGEGQGVTGGVGPHVSQYEFAKSSGIEGLHTFEVHNHAARGGEHVADETRKGARLGIENAGVLTMKDQCTAAGSFYADL